VADVHVVKKIKALLSSIPVVDEIIIVIIDIRVHRFEYSKLFWKTLELTEMNTGITNILMQYRPTSKYILYLAFYRTLDIHIAL